MTTLGELETLQIRGKWYAKALPADRRSNRLFGPEDTEAQAEAKAEAYLRKETL